MDNKKELKELQAQKAKLERRLKVNSPGSHKSSLHARAVLHFIGKRIKELEEKLLAILILFCLAIPSAEASREIPPVKYMDLCKATKAVIWILKDQGAGPKDYRIKFADGYAWPIAAYSRKYGVDIDASAVVAYRESSFRLDVVGSKGELGLFQIHKRKLNDWQDVYENSEKGIKRLSQAVRACNRKKLNTWEHVFGHYRSGRCIPEYGIEKAKLLRKLKRAMQSRPAT